VKAGLGKTKSLQVQKYLGHITSRFQQAQVRIHLLILPSHSSKAV